MSYSTMMPEADVLTAKSVFQISKVIISLEEPPYSSVTVRMTGKFVTFWKHWSRVFILMKSFGEAHNGNSESVMMNW